MKPYLQDADFTLYNGGALDVLRTLPAESVDCCITSPPYWGLRDYGAEGQLGLEPTPEQYVERMVEVFREVRRVLAGHGTCWVNLGDSYASDPKKGGSGTPNGRNARGEKYARELRGVGERAVSGSGPLGGCLNPSAPQQLKPKDLCGIPWRLAFALQADGWYLRSDIVWSKPNPMPESVTDRPTKAHEYVFLLSKQPRYFFDQEAVREPAEWARWGDQTVGPGSNPDGWIKPRTKADLAPSNDGDRWNEHDGRGFTPTQSGRNIRSVWEIATQPFPEAHFATFPEELVRRCLLAGCAEGGVCLDPFIGSGTVALVARKHGRRCVGIELSADYCEMAAKRLQQQSLFAVAS